MSRYNPFAKPKIRPLDGVQSAPQVRTTVSEEGEDGNGDRAVKVSGRSPFDTRTTKDGLIRKEPLLDEARLNMTSPSSQTVQRTAESATEDIHSRLPVPEPRTQIAEPQTNDPPTTTLSAINASPLATIRSTPTHLTTHIQPPTPTSQSISRWRLLWRGGLEVGAQRYKLDGIAFCAKMTFSVPQLPRRDSLGTPTGKVSKAGEDEREVGSVHAMLDKETAMGEEGSYFTHNATEGLSTGSSPLPVITPTGTTPRARRPVLNTQQSAIDGSLPFHTPGGSITAKAFETSDPDLCLSLESMKGRQTLRVRGVERLRDDEVFGQDGESGVHVYLDPGANDEKSSLGGNAHSVLAQYVFNSICRGKVSSSGRTRKALAVTLGDDVIDASSSATFLIYGQLQHSDQSSGLSKPKLELLAARRKPPPKPDTSHGHAGLRPGQPLPRDALYTEDGFKVPTMLSSRTLRRSASIATQAARMSRVRSQSTIYMPPPASTSRSLSRTSSVSTIVESAPQSSTAVAPPGKKLTPGRRGEKRKRPLQQQLAEDEEKRRRSGKIAVEGSTGNTEATLTSGTSTAPESSKRTTSGNGTSKMQGTRQTVPDPSEIVTIDDDDIFGNVNRIENASSNQSTAAKSRPLAISECETRNKASIKKRLLAAMETRGCGRNHSEFKEVFGVTNKGVSFALRNSIADQTLEKTVIERMVKAHLDLYLPAHPDIITIDDDPPTEVQSLPSRLTTTELLPPGTISNNDGYPVAIDAHENPNTTII